MEETPPPPPARVVRVWTPLAVGVYALFLGYPSGLALATHNWFTLGRRREASIHLAGAFVLTVVLLCLILFLPRRAGRLLSLAVTIVGFSYLKARQRSDLEELQFAEPGVVIQYRRWYAGCGWVLVGLSVFLMMAVTLLILAMAAGLPLRD
jgi:hypothetical protein